MAEQKTNWKQLLESPKGCKEYNPTQTFSLQVFWIVRSPKAAEEMIEKGFMQCGKATMRDTPTTLCYFFRISQDQSLAQQYKRSITTIGQHPHYQPAFKSISMGIPRQSIESKLKQGQINLVPLSWSPDEPIAGHEAELDFDPVVLECTEVYLDNKSFYEHAASHDWMECYPEIVMASRSLKPTTYCLGNPTEEVWTGVVEPVLKAIRFNTDERQVVNDLKPNVTINNDVTSISDVTDIFFLEFDISLQKEKAQKVRENLSQIQKELKAPFMIVLPTNVGQGEEPQVVEVRVMMSFLYSKTTECPTFTVLSSECDKMSGRVIVFDEKFGSDKEDIARQNDSGLNFLGICGLQLKLSVLNGHQAISEHKLAGYPLHPLFREIIVTSN